MNEQKIFAQKPKKCPQCGHAPVARILYGLPNLTPELQASLDDGSVVIGGCVIFEESPSWQCTSCQAEYWKRSSVGHDAFR